MRNCSDWIDTFCDYVSDTESPQIFAKWSAISAIAGALRRKCHFSFGRLKTFPNLYIVLVAPPGGRKSVTLSYAKEILTDGIAGLPISSESNTRESLLKDLEESATDCVNIKGETLRYSALTVMSKEFETFLGQKKDNTKLIVTLTDLYDHIDPTWKHKTKHSGNTTIPNVFLNLAGCTTPSSLSSSLPTDAIGGGLTSRILFVYCDRIEKLVPIPELTSKEIRLREVLTEDIRSIGSINGTYTFTEESKKRYSDWYISNATSRRICKDDAFTGWYQRKPLFVQKLAMICKASTSDELEIDWNCFHRAITFLEEIEESMALAFRGVGRSDITMDIDMVHKIISGRDYISDSELMALVWRDIDAKKMDQVISTLHRSNSIKILTRSPTGTAGLFYVSAERRVD